MRSRTWLLAAALAVPAAAWAFQGVQVLHAFSGRDGATPAARLALAADGRLYGTTQAGGQTGNGTVFSLAPDGSGFLSLHSFSGPDGNAVAQGLVAGADGLLYGSSAYSAGALGEGGTLFVQSPSGAFATLFHFPGNSATMGYRPGQLVDGGDGFLYGTNHNGGAGTNAGGSLFRASPGGPVTTVRNFNGPEGQLPEPGLTLGSDGRLYGALSETVSGYGGLFRMERDGSGLVLLHGFAGTDGSQPRPWLAEGPAGVFYGVTKAGGPGLGGTVFRLAADGTVTLLHAFNGDDGAQPTGVAFGPDGHLYGVTAAGGLAGQGTVFRVSPDGEFMTLHLLGASDGLSPQAAAVFGPDGLLYGVAGAGGSHARGTVFRIDPQAAQPVDAGMSKQCQLTIPFSAAGRSPTGCRPLVNIFVGESFTIDWTTANIDSCTASGSWSGPQPTAGRFTAYPTRQGLYRYVLNCTGAGGSRQVSQTVTVGPAP